MGAVTTVYQVTGMTCGHCEGAVSGEISELPGVSSVKAVAATGEVTVVSAAPLDERPYAPPSTRRATSWSARPEPLRLPRARTAAPAAGTARTGSVRRPVHLPGARHQHTRSDARPGNRPRSSCPSAG